MTASRQERQGQGIADIKIPERFRLDVLRRESWEFVGTGRRSQTHQHGDSLVIYFAEYLAPTLRLRVLETSEGMFSATKGDGKKRRYRIVETVSSEENPKRYGRFSSSVQREEENRLTPRWKPPRDWAQNPHILDWWSKDHDRLIEAWIAEHGWAWEDFIDVDEIKAVDPAAYERWMATDPLCERWVHYNLIRNFAIARSEVEKFDNCLAKPVVKACSVCGYDFDSRTARGDLAQFDPGDLCSACLYKAIIAEGDHLVSADSTKAWISDIVEALGRIPSQTIVAGKRAALHAELPPDDDPRRAKTIRLLPRKPAKGRINELFGSWFKALAAAGAVDAGGQRLSRGTRCLAEDGHVCWSIGEKTIDDLLHRAGIPHEREPGYPEGNMRADFKVGDALVEFFGLQGDAEYDVKSEKKRTIAKKCGVELVEIYAEELGDLDTLLEKLSDLKDSADA